jgi:hypothetical protein
MKVAATLIIFFAATASAFGLNNGATSAVKSMTKGFVSKPMVQAVDINGNRLTSAVCMRMLGVIGVFIANDGFIQPTRRS